MGLGVERRIALIGVRFLARDDRTRGHATRLLRTLAALETVADRGAALHAFRNSQPGLVKRMIAAERICSVALIASGIIDRLGMDRPETFFQFRWVTCIGYPNQRPDVAGSGTQNFLL